MTLAIRKSTYDHNYVYTVGFIVPGVYIDYQHTIGSSAVTWESLRDFNRLEDAEAYVNYLNGGDGKRWSLTN